MDLTEELLSYCKQDRQEIPIVEPKPPSEFIIQATEVYQKIVAYETLLVASYEGFIGIHRFISEESIKSNGILYFDDHQRRKFIEETALFISSTAKDIQELNYQMEILILDLHFNQPKIFYQQIVSQLLTKLNKFTRFWDRMQKELKRYHHSAVRLFSEIYSDSRREKRFPLETNEDLSNPDEKRNKSSSLLQPIEQLSLFQETVTSNQQSQAKSTRTHPQPTTAKQLETSFAQRYIDEIATKQKMKEYQAIAVKEKESLLKEAKLLHHKYNIEVIQSQQIENTVMNISSLVGEFATLIQSQTEIVETIGDTTDDVTKAVQSADEELLTTVEKTQSHQWNMMLLISIFSGLLLLLHLLTP